MVGVVNNTEHTGVFYAMYVYKYLKPKQYYIDLHDRITVEMFRDYVKIPIKLPTKIKQTNKKKSQEEFNKVVTDLILYFKKGERYLSKRCDIEKWMRDDRQKDAGISSAKPFSGINCFNCKLEMKCELVDLVGTLDNEQIRFLYRCGECGKGRAVFENGDEYIPKSNIRPSCQAVMQDEHVNINDEITTTSTCPKCNNKTEYRTSLKTEEIIDPDFENDRIKYCLSAKDGEEYRQSVESLNRLKVFLDEIKEKDKNKAIYDKVTKLKRLPISEVKRILNEAFEKHGFYDLQFEKPEIDRYVTVGFLAQDNNADRQEYDSRMCLKKLIEKTLVDTNWRLMSEGINYRLGCVSGKIKGYEKEDDLLKLVK